MWGGRSRSFSASDAERFSGDAHRVERFRVSTGGDEKPRIGCGGLEEGLMELVGH